MIIGTSALHLGHDNYVSETSVTHYILDKSEPGQLRIILVNT